MVLKAGRRAKLSVSARLAIVHDIAARLADSHGLADVTAVIRTSLEAGLGAEAMVLNVLGPDGMKLLTLCSSGTSGRTKSLLQDEVPLDDGPAKAVLSGGEPVYWSTLAQRDREYPGYAGFPSACQAWAILPLTVHGLTFGVLSVGWAEPRRFTNEDSASLLVIAHQCAVAVDRARLEELERAERETLELMSEGTRVMVSELDAGAIVSKLVVLAVPRLAPWCAVYVAERGTLRRVAIEIADQPDLAAQLRGQEAVEVASESPLAICYRTGRPQLVPSVTDREVQHVYRGPLRERIFATQWNWTALVVPIKAGGQVIGVMSLVSGSWGGAPPAGVWHSAEGLAGRAGMALRNARRYDVEHSTASLLTETLLPGELPDVAGYQAAARYIPAEGRVAGDWFDLVRLPSGRFLVGVGDVGGHGLPAASLMLQLRHAARGLAIAGARPAQVVHGLAQLTLMDEAHGFATALYGLLEPERGRLKWSSAGHIPPLTFGPGTARWLSFAEHPPFGVPTISAAVEHRHQVGPDEGMVLLTDGVVERRGADIGEGLDHLADFVAHHSAVDAMSLAGAIASEFCAAPQDDCCIVVLRRT